MNLLKIALESDARREEQVQRDVESTDVPNSELEIDPATPAPDTEPPAAAVPASRAADRRVPATRTPEVRSEGDTPPVDGGEPQPEEEIPVLADVEVDDEGTVIENGLGDAEEIETDIVRADQEREAEFNDADTVSSAMESLFILESNVAAIIRNKTYTAETAGLIRNQVDFQLNRVNAQLDWNAMESDADDLAGQHQFALEGIREGLKKMAQNVSMQFKHTFNAVGDVFRSTESAIGKYEEQLNKLEEKLNAARGKWQRNEHQADLTQLWYFFTTDKGPSRDIAADARKDLAMSSYVLGEYHKLALDTMLKAIATFSAARPQSKDQAKRIFAEIEKIEMPASSFKQEFLGGQPYFNRAGLVLNQGSKRTPITFDGVTFEKLAQLASPITVVETSSLAHKVKKAVLSPAGGRKASMFQYKSDDIQEIIETGRAYIKNVRTALSHASAFNAADKKWSAALDNFFLADFKGTELADADLKAYDRLAFQLAQLSDNLIRNFSSPANAEMARSLRAAKYCGYMAATMIRFAT